MPLPKIDSPIFEITLPSSGKKLNYRSFTVKEEKILLIAQETKEISQALLGVKQVINNCLINSTVEELSMFDLEFILLTLRSKSVDNHVKFTIVDPDTKETIPLELNLDNVKVITPDNHTNEIVLDDTYTLYMRYPSIDEFTLMINNPDDKQIIFDIMVECMDKLVTVETVEKFSDYTLEERVQFADDITSSTAEKMNLFFDTAPKLRHELKYTNSNGDEKIFVIEGMQTFFL